MSVLAISFPSSLVWSDGQSGQALLVRNIQPTTTIMAISEIKMLWVHSTCEWRSLSSGASGFMVASFESGTLGLGAGALEDLGDQLFGFLLEVGVGLHDLVELADDAGEPIPVAEEAGGLDLQPP